jgi:hypothetical protein
VQPDWDGVIATHPCHWSALVCSFNVTNIVSVVALWCVNGSRQTLIGPTNLLGQSPLTIAHGKGWIVMVKKMSKPCDLE